MSNRVSVSKNILTWAIDRAGYDLPTFEEKYPIVRKWIDGEKDPTVKQLETFSKKVYLPFGYLFLSDPPKEELPIPFFRTQNKAGDRISVNVFDTILLIERRQDWLRNYLMDQEADSLPYVGKFKDGTNPIEIAQDIRNELGVSETWASGFSTWTDALNHLVEIVEDKGIIVSFNGIVENNTNRKIPVDECRGFVLVDNIAPFLFINNADFKSAQMFTLAHELAHIWTGVSAGFDFRQMLPSDDPIEKLCDEVAAEFLVPEKAFNEAWSHNPDTKSVAREFKVSEIVVARRALDTKKWTRKEFFNFYEEYERGEFVKKGKKSDGGNFWNTAKKRLSITFSAHVSNAVRSGQLLYRDAYKLTSMRGETFEKYTTKHL